MWVALVMIAIGVVGEIGSGLRFEAIWKPMQACGRGAPCAAVVNAVVARLFLYAGIVALVISALTAAF